VAQPRHKREPQPRRLAPVSGKRAARIAAGAAMAATLPAVGLGVLAADPAALSVLHSHRSAALDLAADRPTGVSRSLDRAASRHVEGGFAALGAEAVRTPALQKWTTTDLNLWTSSSSTARQVGVVPAGKPVLLTGRVAGGRIELAIGGVSRWVTTGYLADHKPAAGSTITAAAGLSMAPCPDPSVEYRLTQAAVYVYRSVCHAFPQITSYGGWAARGEHASGKAIDIMTSDVALGNAIAAFLQQHAAQLHLYDILWRQHIWTPVRASEGWRLFANRGSPTANHMDHVHVSVS
jgi:hypothetical protein